MTTELKDKIKEVKRQIRSLKKDIKIAYDEESYRSTTIMTIQLENKQHELSLLESEYRKDS